MLHNNSLFIDFIHFLVCEMNNFRAVRKMVDQYNGHSLDDLGYHYHVTATQVDGKLSPSFPYTIGDKFAGELADNSLATCGGGAGGPPPMRAAQ